MKERLTGAIILVALLVLLVPELLTGPSRSVPSTQAPSNTDGAQMRSYTIDLTDDAAARRSTPPPVAETLAPEEMPAEAPASGASARAGGGTTDARNGAGTGQAEGADTSGGHSGDPTRGDPTRQASEAAPVLAEPEKSPAPRAEPLPAARNASEPASHAGSAGAHPASGWAVQVGSFASRENAERLARELKGKGFATTITESSAKGKRLWRVRVGPEPNRAEAVALGARLHSAGQPGAVVPYP